MRPLVENERFPSGSLRMSTKANQALYWGLFILHSCSKYSYTLTVRNILEVLEELVKLSEDLPLSDKRFTLVENEKAKNKRSFVNLRFEKV